MCVCSMPIDDAVEADVYQLDLWAGQQLLWSGSFQPSKHGEWGRVGQGCGGAVPGPQLSSGAGEAGSSWGSELQAISCIVPDMMRFLFLSEPQSSHL